MSKEHDWLLTKQEKNDIDSELAESQILLRAVKARLRAAAGPEFHHTRDAIGAFEEGIRIIQEQIQAFKSYEEKNR